MGTPVTTYSYTYGTTWKDKLTKYDGVTITYDALGNPLSYRGKTLTWQNGRELASVDGTTSYTYGADGIRTAKTVSGVTTTYALSGSTILSQTKGNETLFFYYDANGRLTQIGYKNGASAEVFYFVTHNLQGDVTAIYNAADSTLVGTYTYDPWGRVLAVTAASSTSDPNSILTKNPFRYRGYYYDAETGLYYVSSRYYDPEICRWINADDRFDEGAGFAGYNLFTYCANNPVNLFDPEGGFVISTLLVCVIAGAVVGGTVGGIIGNHYANSKGYSGWDKTKCILTGVAIGGVGGGAIGYVAAPLVVSATGVAGISITSTGVSTVAAVGTSFGKIGTLVINDGQQIINWGRTTIHGMQRMAERGVTPAMAEYWVKTGKALQQAGDKVLYVTRQGAVVVNKAGQVITAYTSQDFDENMQRIVNQLFGK